MAFNQRSVRRVEQDLARATVARIGGLAKTNSPFKEEVAYSKTRFLTHEKRNTFPALIIDATCAYFFTQRLSL